VLLDRSRLDAAIARRLLRRGATPEHVAATIAAGEKARSLPPGEAETYAQRTLAAAMRDATGP
jgi:uncharacterized protein (DUF2062 family)